MRGYVTICSRTPNTTGQLFCDHLARIQPADTALEAEVGEVLEIGPSMQCYRVSAIYPNPCEETRVSLKFVQTGSKGRLCLACSHTHTHTAKCTTHLHCEAAGFFNAHGCSRGGPNLHTTVSTASFQAFNRHLPRFGLKASFPFPELFSNRSSLLTPGCTARGGC